MLPNPKSTQARTLARAGGAGRGADGRQAKVNATATPVAAAVSALGRLAILAFAACVRVRACVAQVAAASESYRLIPRKRIFKALIGPPAPGRSAPARQLPDRRAAAQ